MNFRTILRYLPVAAVFLLLSASVLPAQTEKDDGATTLANLFPELKQSYEEALGSDSLLVDNGYRRQELAEMIRSADEVAVMTYTQRPGFAIDMAIALENVSRVYDSLREEARLSDKYLSSSRAGLLRYSLLGETLREMYGPPSLPDSLTAADSRLLQELPPSESFRELDPEEKALLDSCLFYTDALAALYGKSVALALQDSVSFAGTESRLKQAYDYVQANYAEAQRNIFIGSNLTLFQIISNWDTYIAGVRSDMELRFRPEALDTSKGRTLDLGALSGRDILTYGFLSFLALILAFLIASIINGLIFKKVRKESIRSFKPILSAILGILLFVLGILLVNSDRSDPYWQSAYQLLSVFSWLTLAIFVSLLIRVSGSQARPSLRLYIPTLLLAFMNILLRAMFTPASIVPFIFPPALLAFIIWQSCVNVRYRKDVLRTDLRYTWVSVFVMVVACVLSLVGYSMIGVFLLTFWTFELALLHTITTIYFLMKRYNESRVIRKIARYRSENPFLPLEEKEDFIEVTWIYDLLRMVVLPVTILMSFPLGVKLTSSAYQLSLTGADFMDYTIFNNVKVLEHLTLRNLLIILVLFFVFRFLIYFVKNMMRLIRLRNVIDKKQPASMPLKRSDVNTSLSDALFSLLGWLIFLFIVFSILQLSGKALTTISAGLAAGVGFALKDLINNFFYGVQLMAGRIKVGDKISCDGVRGIVKRVSYQTTVVEDEDGSLIAFTNTDLFTKKFRNLNSGRNYEFLKIPVSVRYGTDVARAREVILEALKPLMTKDKAGRDVVDPSFPVDVRFDSFGDSSVNLVVALYSTVETHYTFPARAKEAIYNAFHENGIDIPFQQHDIYIKQAPEDERDREKQD